MAEPQASQAKQGACEVSDTQKRVPGSSPSSRGLWLSWQYLLQFGKRWAKVMWDVGCDLTVRCAKDFGGPCLGGRQPSPSDNSA